MKKGRQLGRAIAPNTSGASKKPPQVRIMVIFISASIKEIKAKGSDFPWPRPEVCPICKSPGLWGHGFVGAYFDCADGQVLLRRYRCPFCKSVHRVRPAGYFRRFQASIARIRFLLAYYLICHRPPSNVCRVRLSHWLKGLRRKVWAFFGDAFHQSLLHGFSRLVAMGITPVSRII